MSVSQSSKYLGLAVLIGLLGGVFGAGGAYFRMAGEKKGDLREAVVPVVEGQTAKTPVDVAGETERGSSTSSLPVVPVKETPKTAPVPAVKSAVKVSPNLCAAAKKQLDDSLKKAESEHGAAVASAKKSYDAEIAEASAKLSDLQKQRGESVNNYLTAIAIATSKYNSSKDGDAYEVYQREQAAALDAYTKKITELDAAESPALKAKKDAQDKQTAGLSSADIKLAADKAAAEGQYSKGVSGKSCL